MADLQGWKAVLRDRFRQVRRRVIDAEVENHLRLLAATRGGRELDVLVLGDSQWLWTAYQDTDRRTMFEMFHEALPASISRHVIVGGGYHAGLYVAFMRAFAAAGHPAPRVVVMPTNARTLSPQWHYAAEYRFDSAIARIERAARSRRPWLLWPAPKRLGPADMDAYDDVVHRSAFDPPRTVGEYRRLIAAQPTTPTEKHDRWRVIFSFFYGEPADVTNPRLGQLREVAALITSRGSHLISYSIPANVEGGRELLGPGFDDHWAREVARAEAAVREGAGDAFTWLPWASALPASDFIHRYEPSEHLAEAGRRWMVAGLVDAVQAALNR